MPRGRRDVPGGGELAGVVTVVGVHAAGRHAGLLLDGDRCVVSHAVAGDGTLLAEALGRFGIEGISARRLDARLRHGSAGEAWLRIPVQPATAPERPRLALIQRLPLPG